MYTKRLKEIIPLLQDFFLNSNGLRSINCPVYNIFYKLMYFFRYGLGYMKGNERYTVFMGVNTVSNIFFYLDNSCASNCSIVFFLVLDRCLIACYVEMYAELFEEKKLVFFFFQESFVLIHTYPTF